MSFVLPPLVAALAQAMNDHDADALAVCFTEDAVVHDEGQEVRGRAAIREWADDVHARYRISLQVTGFAEQGDKSVLSALVSGSFDGSPIAFDYHLTIRNGKIAVFEVR